MEDEGLSIRPVSLLGDDRLHRGLILVAAVMIEKTTKIIIKTAEECCSRTLRTRTSRHQAEPNFQDREADLCTISDVYFKVDGKSDEF